MKSTLSFSACNKQKETRKRLTVLQVENQDIMISQLSPNCTCNFSLVQVPIWILYMAQISRQKSAVWFSGPRDLPAMNAPPFRLFLMSSLSFKLQPTVGESVIIITVPVELPNLFTD